MKTATLKEINELKVLCAARKDRVSAISRRAAQIIEEYKTANTAKKEQLAIEVRDLHIELQDHKKFLREADKELAAFYAPAIR